MIRSIPVLLLLCSGAVFLSIKSNKKFEQTLPVWILFIITILYFTGIFDILLIGVYIVVLISALGLLYSIYFLIKNKHDFVFNILTPGFFIFIFFFIISWWAQNGRMFISWDEFSHWGLVVKNMYMLNALGNHPNATTAFVGYPPSTALFEYLWARLSGVFIEGDTYRAINILYFSLMLPLFKNLKRKTGGQLIVCTILVLILPLAFYSDFYTLLCVDGILGILFAYILISHFTCGLSNFNILNISLALFVLTLTKATGVIFALIAFIIFAIDMLFSKRSDLLQYIRQNKSNSIFIRSAILLTPLISILTAKCSWSIYVNATNTIDVYNVHSIFSLSVIKNLLNGNAPIYWAKTIYNFFIALTEQVFSNNLVDLTFIGWLVLLISLSIICIAFICKKDEKTRYKIAAISFFTGTLIYMFGMLFTYLIAFSEYEAVNLASFQRYSSTYLLGGLVFFASVILLKEPENETSHGKIFSVGLALLMLITIKLTPILNLTVLSMPSINSTIDIRSINQWAIPPEQLLNPKIDKVYFISIADKGFDYWVNRYNLTPVKTNTYAWSIGQPYYEGDIWTEDISSYKWSEILKNEYTYVYIHRTNEIFSREYGDLFDGGTAAVQNDSLYFIDKTKDVIALKKVDFK